MTKWVTTYVATKNDGMEVSVQVELPEKTDPETLRAHLQRFGVHVPAQDIQSVRVEGIRYQRQESA